MAYPLRRIPVDEFTVAVLQHYRGESPQAVVHRAMRLLALADGHLDGRGQLKPSRLRKAAS